MFGLSYFATVVFVSIFSLIITVLVVLPNIFKLKNTLWLSLKVVLIIVFAILVIVFTDIKTDSYYFLGSFLGVGFLVKGIILSNRLSLLSFLASMTAFSFIFLSIGHSALFVLSLCFTYLLMIGITAFSLYQSKNFKIDFQLPIESQIVSFVGLLTFPIISIFTLYFLTQNEYVWYENISFFSLFSRNYAAITFLIIVVLFILIAVVISIIELRSKNKERIDEPWYT